MKNETLIKTKTTASDKKKVDTSLSSKEQEILATSKAAKPASFPTKPPKGTPEPRKSKTDDARHVYRYILSTKNQREKIDLRKSKIKLEKLFQSYFDKRLLSVKIEVDSYTLSLTDEFKVGEKRMLGRQVGVIDDMKKHAKIIYYNNGQDHSTQLFKLVKEK